MQTVLAFLTIVPLGLVCRLDLRTSSVQLVDLVLLLMSNWPVMYRRAEFSFGRMWRKCLGIDLEY